MAADTETVELLKEAVSLLRIIARPQMMELQERFEASMLSSPKRRQMWKEMDGSRSLTDIAKKVGVSAEAVRQFVADVNEKWPGLLEMGGEGGAVWPKRLI